MCSMSKKNILFVSFFSLVFIFVDSISSAAFPQTNSLKTLNETLSKKDFYDQRKEKRMEGIRRKFLSAEDDLQQKFSFSQELYEEYKKYLLDSAEYYAYQSHNIATALDDAMLTALSEIQLASVFSAQGKYIEAEDILNQVQSVGLDTLVLKEYYTTYSDFCSQYAQNSQSGKFFELSNLYRDSLLYLLPKNSKEYKLLNATKQFYNGRREQAADFLLKNLYSDLYDDREKAYIAYLLGLYYHEKEDILKEIKFLEISATIDTRLSTKDNASLHSLAMALYNNENIDEAFLVINEALKDSEFSNVRFRNAETSSFYTLINDSLQEKEQKQKEELKAMLLVISLLSIVLFILIFSLYRQNTRLKEIRKVLSDKNIELKELNNELLFLNDSLKEANHIKEEYIAQFFDICSSYIDKIESYRVTLLKEFNLNNHRKIKNLLKSPDLIQHELSELYHNFDIIFLHLYPNFIKDFNELLRKDSQIVLKPNELLNNELRIYALIRLGIHDSKKIAGFLRYSLRTVYNYTAKVRAKLAVSKEYFESKIKNIGGERDFS